MTTDQQLSLALDLIEKVQHINKDVLVNELLEIIYDLVNSDAKYK